MSAMRKLRLGPLPKIEGIQLAFARLATFGHSSDFYCL